MTSNNDGKSNNNVIDNSVFINGILEQINSICSQDQLVAIKQRLNVYVDDYYVTQKNYSVAIREEYPKAYRHFLVSKKLEGLSETTLKNYKSHLDNFFKVVTIPLEQITPQTIQSFLYQYSKEIHGNSATCVPTGHTINQYQAILSTFFSWSYANGYVSENPCSVLKKTKYQKKEIDVLTEEQLKQIIDCANHKDLRTRAIVQTFISTGLRVSELVNIKLSNFDWNVSSEKLISLKVENGKGGKDRTVFITDDCAIAILDYIQTRNSDSEYLFVRTTNGNGQLTTRTIQNIITELGNECGIDGLHPHQLRHTVATEMARKGTSINLVQKLLGHASSSTTTGYYVKAEYDLLEKEVKEKMN